MSEAATPPALPRPTAVVTDHDNPASPPASRRRSGSGLLTPQQSAFVTWYLVLGNGTEAALRAGYSEKNAKYQAHHNLRYHPGIQAAVAEAERAVQALRQQYEDAARREAVEGAAKLAAHETLTREWVIDRLRENVARAMQAEPVLDREGNPTGEYTYQGAVANGALKLLGEEIGMFVQRSKVDVTHRSPSRLTEVERNAMLREFLEDRGN